MSISLKQYRYEGGEKLKLAKRPTACEHSGEEKKALLARMEKNLSKMEALQDALYAEAREGVVFVLQAMDAAGKDSTIKHVLGPLNPQGVRVTSFKQPTGEELAHDYLWRAHRAIPERGMIGIFNRSYYEDVLVVRVHDLQQRYQMAERCLDESDDVFFDKRYRQIRHFEEYLYENSYRVVKIFLHVSPETQKKRFLARIDDPAKNWKFSTADLEERKHWDEYMEAYGDAISRTATEHSPWYIVPADDKWFMRVLVSEIVTKTLEECKPDYPDLPAPDKANLAACKQQLLAEEGKVGEGG